MTIEAIAAIGSETALSATATTLAGGAIQPGVFDAVLAKLGEVNDGLLSSQEAVRKLALGETDNLHQVVMQAERARLQFDIVLQVRNKVLDAYQELLRMQI